MISQNGHEWDDSDYDTCCNHCAVTIRDYIAASGAACPGGTHKHAPTNTETNAFISETEADRLWRTIVDAAAR